MDSVGMDKINDLTEGPLFDEFIKATGLTSDDAMYLKNQLIEDYNNYRINEDSVEDRLNELVNTILISKGYDIGLDPEEKLLTYYYNQDYTLMHCTVCGNPILYNDNYCSKCGSRTQYHSNTSLGFFNNRKINNIPDNNTIQEDFSDNTVNEIMFDDNVFKYAIVTYLNILNDPSSDNLDDNTFNYYNTTIDDVKQFSLDNNLINESVTKENFLSLANGLSVSQLKQILSGYKIDTNGNKIDLITRLIDNLNITNLKKIFDTRAYILTSQGLNLIIDNPQIYFYNKFLKTYSLEKFQQLYQENKDTLNLSQIGLLYMNNYRKEYANKLKWGLYKNTYYVDYNIFKYTNKKNPQLLSLLKILTCDINLWEDNILDKDSLLLAPAITNNICKIVYDEKIQPSDLKEFFIKAVDSLEIPALLLSKEAMFQYLIKIINKEPLDKIQEEIKEKYNNLESKYHFDNLTQQQEVVYTINTLIN